MSLRSILSGFRLSVRSLLTNWTSERRVRSKRWGRAVCPHSCLRDVSWRVSWLHVFVRRCPWAPGACRFVILAMLLGKPCVGRRHTRDLCSVFVYTYKYVCAHVNMSVYLPVCLLVYLFVCVSICLSFCLLICLSVCPSICQSVCKYACTYM